MLAGYVLLLVDGLIHVLKLPDMNSKATYLGVLFALNVIAAFALAGGVLLNQSRAWGLGTLLCLMTMAGYVLARTVGLPYDLDNDWTDPIGVVPVGLVSLLVELSFVVLFVWLRATRRFMTS
jgi:uncharacterized membrane protein